MREICLPNSMYDTNSWWKDNAVIAFFLVLYQHDLLAYFPTLTTKVDKPSDKLMFLKEIGKSSSGMQFSMLSTVTLQQLPIILGYSLL